MAESPTGPETTPDAAPPPPPERQGWRSRPFAKRLPLLLLVGLGLWIWKVTGTPERQLVWQLTGPGWTEVRAVDFQVMDEDGHILKRAELSFSPSGPPPELTFDAPLPEGTWRVWFFVKRHGQAERLRLEESVTVGDETYSVRQLRLPDAGR